MSTTSLAFDIIARDRASDKFDKVGRSAGGASDKLKKFAKVGAAAAAAGAVVVGKALLDMTKGAIEDQKAQTLLAKTLKNTTGATDKQIASVEDWITAQGKALGVADDDLRPALQRMAEATGDVGKAQKLASLAMNISAGTGKSLKTVSEALAKAQMGQVGALSRYGIATRDASGEMMSFDEVTKKAAKTFGGQAAEAANTTEGKFKRLKLMFDETKESIGAKLIPVAEKIATFLIQDMVPAAQKLGQWLSEKLGPPLRELSEKWLTMARDRMGALKEAFDSAKPFLEIVGKVLGAVVIPALGKLLEVTGTLVNVGLKALGKALGAIGEAGKWMWNNALQPVFSFLASAISKSMELFGKMLAALGKAPGFGWAKEAGEALQNAAVKAQALGDNIKKIPDRKDVQVHVTTIQHTTPGREGKGQLNTPGGYARGGITPGGVVLVGEEGPELVDLPGGSRVHTAAQTRALVADSRLTEASLQRALERAFLRALEQMPITRLEDAGRNAHLRGSW